MKILIAEDDYVSQQILRRTLESVGHEVIVSKNGLEALQAYQDHPVNMVVSDWQMPEMDGLELCTAIRALPRRNYTYFILLSATFTTHDKYVLAMETGVDDFLLKPLDRDAIMMRLMVGERITRFSREINQLKGLLPICMYCKKIRDDANYWQQIESYIKEHTGSDFTHGICPECYDSVVQPRLDEINAGLPVSAP